jgi:hypothetical protein
MNFDLRRCWPSAVALIAACSGTDATVCRVGADCASGVCGADGRCTLAVNLPVDARSGPDARFGDMGPRSDTTTAEVAAEVAQDMPPSVDAPTPQDTKTTPDAAPQQDTPAVDAAPAFCQPNHDGTVARSEVTLAAGQSAPFRIAHDVPVDLAGQKGPKGESVWDFSASQQGDKTVAVKTLPVAGQWYADKFPGATYAAQLQDGNPLLGVFETTDSALLLRGVVSPEDGFFATRITYDPPLPALQFPLTQTSAWTATATASGLYQGVIMAWSEKFEAAAAGAGVLQTPIGNFPVLRVRTRLDKLVAGFTTTYRSALFVAECWGVVAKVDSQSGETKADFSKAAELRRVAAP